MPLRAAPHVAAVQAEHVCVSEVQPMGTCCSIESIVLMGMVVNIPDPRGWESVLC